MRRLICSLMALVLVVLLLPPRPAAGAAAPAPAFTVDYTLTLAEADRAAVVLDVHGAPGPATSLSFVGSSDSRNAITSPAAAATDGRSLPCRWEQGTLVVDNGQLTDFTIRYGLDAKLAVSGTNQTQLILRPLTLFFTADNAFLIPEVEPRGITVRFVVPPETKVFASLPEENGVFTAVRDLWGDLRYDFAKAYFSGGRPLFTATRTTAWGDTYEYVWFDRDVSSEMWLPSYGDTPWEEAQAYLAQAEQLMGYIREHVVEPLPVHKVLFTNTKWAGPGAPVVLTNVDFYNYMQIWPRHSEPEVAHHLFHGYSFWINNSKLPLDYSGVGHFLREGLPTYLEQTVPAVVYGDEAFRGKLFESYALEQRGQAFGIGANEMHVKYNRSAIQVYLLDQYIKTASGGVKDITAFARALWDRVKDRTAPQNVDDDLVLGAFVEAAGAGGDRYFSQVAAMTQFRQDDFMPLLPDFEAYVDEMAGRYFWGNRLLFLAFLDIAAAKGAEWPHYATYPHNIIRYRQEALPAFKQYLENLHRSTLTEKDIEEALGAATGRSHAGFFDFWSGLGLDLNPSDLPALDRWNPADKDESDLVAWGESAGLLQTEHYLSGLPQRASVTLDRPADSQTILLGVTLSGFDDYPPEAAATRAVSAPLEFTQQLMDGNIHVTRAYFRLTMADPKRQQFSVDLTLPAFAYHPQFQVYQVGPEGNQLIGALYWLHSLDPVPFEVRKAGGVISLPTMPLDGGSFTVTAQGKAAQVDPGQPILVGSGSVQVDLLDRCGFLRGRQALATTADSVQVICDGRLLEFDVPPRQVNGRNMVPFRAIAEALGAEVGFDPASQTITLTQEDRVVILTIGAPTARVNGQTVTLDVPAQSVNGRTLVPIRFIGEALGADVKWDQASQAVIITTGQ